jgi:hypothetical protein
MKQRLDKIFYDLHHVGAERFGSNWLVANTAAVHCIWNLGLDAEMPIIRTLTTKIVFAILSKMSEKNDTKQYAEDWKEESNDQKE